MTDMATTTPPEKLVQIIKNAMPLIDALAGSPESESGEEKITSEKAPDFLRKLFPHLDDLTLAAFTSYVATNLAAAGSMCECDVAIRLGVLYARMTKVLAWSLDTPEAAK